MLAQVGLASGRDWDSNSGPNRDGDGLPYQPRLPVGDEILNRPGNLDAGMTGSWDSCRYDFLGNADRLYSREGSGFCRRGGLRSSGRAADPSGLRL